MAVTTQIDLSSLHGGTRRLVLQESIGLPPYGTYSFPHAVEIALEIENLGDVVDVYGTASLVYTSSCDRCLEDFVAPLTVNIDEHVETGSSSDPFGDNNVILDGKLDVADLVRQLVNAELPFVSLCRSDCAGLCLSCGLNLNERPCSCQAATKGDHG